VSVVIRCGNNAHYLHEATTSVVEQTYQDFEVIIVSDAPNAATQAQCHQLLDQLADQRLTIIQRNSQGQRPKAQPAISRNLGIEHARGEFILALESRDKLAPEMLAACVNLLDRSPEVAIAYTNRRDFGDVEGIVTASDYDYSTLRYANQIAHCALYRKKAWERVGGYRTNVGGCEDWDFWVAAGALGFHGQHLDAPLFLHRRESLDVYQDVLDNPDWYLARIILNNRKVYESEALTWANKVHARTGSKPEDATPTCQKLAATPAKAENRRIAAEPQPPATKSDDAARRGGIPGEPPLVSVVLITHEHPDRLAESVASVLSQTHEHLELIVVNDGGNDVAHVIRDLDGSGRAQYVQLSTRLGASGARNVGLRLARGKYLAFLDNGNWLEPHHVACLVDALEPGSHQVAYAYARRIIQIEDDGAVVTKRVDQADPAWCAPFSADALLATNTMAAHGVLFHRDCLRAVGYFDETLPVFEDWEFWIRLSRAFDFKHVNTTSSTVRWYSDSLMNSGHRDALPSAERIIKRYRHHAESNDDIQQAQAALLTDLAAQKRPKPTVSIVLHATNDAERNALTACLQAIMTRTRGVAHEIIVASVGEAPQIGDAPPIKWISMPDGEKPTSAINTAVAHATGRYLALVDSNARVRVGWLQPLVAYADEDANVAAVGGQTLGPDGRIDHVAIEVAVHGRARRLFVGGKAHHERLTTIEGANVLAGSVVLVRAGDFADQGGLMTWSSSREAIGELCLRVSARGKRIAIAPRSVCYTTVSSALNLALLEVRHGELFEPQTNDAEQARELVKQGQIEQASMVVNRLLECSPDHGDGWLVRGVIALQHGDTRDAVDAFARAAARGAEPLASQLGLAMALLASHQVEDAWRRLQPLAARYPDDSKVAHFMFAAGTALERWPAVAQALEQYLLLNPGDLDKRFAISSVYVRMNDAALARKHADIVARSAPDYEGLELLHGKITAITDPSSQEPHKPDATPRIDAAPQVRAQPRA